MHTYTQASIYSCVDRYTVYHIYKCACARACARTCGRARERLRDKIHARCTSKTLLCWPRSSFLRPFPPPASRVGPTLLSALPPSPPIGKCKEMFLSPSREKLWDCVMRDFFVAWLWRPDWKTPNIGKRLRGSICNNSNDKEHIDEYWGAHTYSHIYT